VNISIITSVDCLSCDPANVTAFVDACGVCGGDNSTCTGCDGVLFSNVVFDICGVCGGSNDTCLGCNNQPFGPTYDICGICNGTNTTCLGCDGVPLSGLQVNSCGQCGGPVNCDNNLQTVIIALSVFAGIAIAALIIALLLGLCVGVRMAQIDEMMIEEEAALQENPLYEAARRKIDNHLYGKPTEGE